MTANLTSFAKFLVPTVTSFVCGPAIMRTHVLDCVRNLSKKRLFLAARTGFELLLKCRGGAVAASNKRVSDCMPPHDDEF